MEKKITKQEVNQVKRCLALLLNWQDEVQEKLGYSF